jgi:hypothetical protein
MLEFLPLHADVRGLEGLEVEVAARAAQAAEESAALADVAAEVQQQGRARPLHLHLGAAHDRCADLEGLAQEIEHGEVEVDELVPARLQDLLQPRRVLVEERRLAVGVLERLEVRRAPGAVAALGVVHHLLEDGLLLADLHHRHGEPLRRVVAADRGAVLVVAALELHVVQDDEDVGLHHAVEVTQPRYVMGLVNGDEHFRSFACVRDDCRLRVQSFRPAIRR